MADKPEETKPEQPKTFIESIVTKPAEKPAETTVEPVKVVTENEPAKVETVVETDLVIETPADSFKPIEAVKTEQLLSTPTATETQSTGQFVNWQGRHGRHPKNCVCPSCEETRKRKGQPRLNGKAEPQPIPPRNAFQSEPEFQQQNGEPTQQAQSDNLVVDYQEMAYMVFDMSIGTMTMVFGEEWQPRQMQIGENKVNERDMVCVPLRNYLKSKGATDLPPGYILAAVCLAYAAPRFRQPNTATKIKLAWLWFKTKVLRKK